MMDKAQSFESNGKKPLHRCMHAGICTYADLPPDVGAEGVDAEGDGHGEDDEAVYLTKLVMICECQNGDRDGGKRDRHVQPSQEGPLC